jgi:cellulose synthase/poly-beta-1,6-N-acetylglucosamine synthase-like glycosyltransferase
LIDVLTLLALILVLIHFGFPLLYYLYLRSRWLNRDWGVVRDPGCAPKVSIIIPTYNEANLIESKLNNIVFQSYPKELMEVIVVDSASSDGTQSAVRKWVESHRDVKAVLVEEPVRRGKAHALNNALRLATGEIVVVTDADSTWLSRDTLTNALAWFSDPGVGAVTCLKIPVEEGFAGVEKGYRDFYNVVRLGESKKFSTPVFHGELAAFRKSLLQELGGFPTNTGADDSHTATLIALKGYRAIAVDNAICTELVP